MKKYSLELALMVFGIVAFCALVFVFSSPVIQAF